MSQENVEIEEQEPWRNGLLARVRRSTITMTGPKHVVEKLMPVAATTL
jgi:hypothetical protein